jgi:signal transduction histidine kinase
MTMDGKKDSPERGRTDESLRTERRKTDRALAEKQESVDEDADLVLQRARENADAVLVAAREKADEQLEQGASAAAPLAGVAEERVAEDEALRHERAAADESLRREREADAQALSKLLPLERDKTDRYLLTERARADDAMSNRDDFLGIASHDLRNLLGGIVMSAALVSKRASGSEESKATLVAMDRIQRYAARMNRLIGDLVDVASIDAGKLAMTPASVDAASLVDEAIDTFAAAASAKGISLQAERVAQPLLAELDRDRILQVLANLITNSIKFTASGGSIVLRAEREGDQLRFSIRDTGSGIPADKLEAVFERFWQVGKNDRRGVGLGLYISRCIVEAHGGRIWAESTLGVGSTLCFTLPVAPVSVRPDALTSASVAPG